MTEEALVHALDDHWLRTGRHPEAAYLHPDDRRPLCQAWINEGRRFGYDVAKLNALALALRDDRAKFIYEVPSGPVEIIADVRVPRGTVRTRPFRTEPIAGEIHALREGERPHHYDGEMRESCPRCSELA